ncbi:hypothetical protein IF188_11220 [Microbacterium sp. NEAU-LLC]|uniref:Transcriptional repressor PaaX-like C-terminal domain-containing protein n=1 Tax=Microbacterium helvum TaxID=2773713 RepID=A0ABR8NNM6_9MICO|nr:PaaX family transcriptional regulator C-terminal domain-containing protein [Microbacterium helvum]MBD3942267.1 hypothetical protein [Microbacterium helvum]
MRPGDHRAEVEAMVAELPAAPTEDQLTVFVGARLSEQEGPRIVRDAFGLDELAAAYRRFAEEWEPVAQRLRDAASGRRGRGAASVVDENEALRLRTSIMREWRELRHADPMLPQELLGSGFPFERALSVCAAIYDSTGAAAEAAFRRILAPHAPELTSSTSHHTFAAYAGEGSAHTR